MVVPQVQNVELIRQVPRSHTQKVPRQIAKPVIQVRERTVEVPQVTLREGNRGTTRAEATVAIYIWVMSMSTCITNATAFPISR